MKKIAIVVFCFIALAGCQHIQEDKISIEIVRRLQMDKPIKVKIFTSCAAFKNSDLRDFFKIEKGHYPLVYRIHTARNDQMLVDAFYVTKNQDEESVFKQKANNFKEFILFTPDKEVRITPGNDIKYITGKIMKKH